MNIISVTIGIPAYNEERTIGQLIKTILFQKEKSFYIKEIIICSDASTDNTVQIVKSMNCDKIKLLINSHRSGQATTQNQIIDNMTSDILVLLNADVLIQDNTTIAKLVAPIIAGEADLTSCRMESISDKSFVATILDNSIEIKNQIYEKLNNGQNVYTCHGAARAFSSKLISNFRFKSSIGEDAFSYLFIKQQNLKYKYVSSATVFIISPSNIFEHTKQSLRFRYSKKFLEHEFGEKLIKSEYDLPIREVFMICIKNCKKQPIKTAFYLLLTFLIYINSKIIPFKYSETWSIAHTSKQSFT